MRPFGGERSLQSMQRSTEVRGDHQIFVERAGSSLAASVLESSQMLKSVGPVGSQSKSMGDFASSGLGVVTAPALPLHPHQISQAAPKYRGSARELFAALQASPSTLAALPVRGERQSSSSRSPSPRVSAGSGPGGEGSSPRMVTVKDFQRGAPLIAPAQLLPFPGDGQSPGRRRRLAEMTAGGRSNILDPARGVPRQQKEREDLADGVTAMISPVHCEIGPLKTTPVAECLALMKAIESPRRVPGCSGFSVSRCFQMFPRSGKTWVCTLHILVCVHMVKNIDLFSKKC